MLASKGLPTLREAEKSDDGDGQQDQTAPERETKDDPGKAQEPEPGVSVQEAARLREDGEGAVLDVRDQEEWDAGHIPDALWIYEANNIEGGMEAWHDPGLPMEPVHGRVV